MYSNLLSNYENLGKLMQMHTFKHHTNSRSIKLVSNDCEVIHSKLIYINFDFANSLSCICVDKNPGKFLG